MKQRKVKKTDVRYILKYELFEAMKIMLNRNGSQYQCNTSYSLYQRAYKGNGLRLLLAGRKTVMKWSISFSTTAKIKGTDILTTKPHFMSFAVDKPCTMNDVVVSTSGTWFQDLLKELNDQDLEAVAINVEIRNILNK